MQPSFIRRILLLIMLALLLVTPACSTIKGFSIPFTGGYRLASTAAPTKAASPTSPPTAAGTPFSAAMLSPTDLPSKPGYHLVLNENFDGSTLNGDRWNTRYRSGSTNPPELEKYVPDAVNIQSGILSLTADRNPEGGMPFTSGMIASYNRFYFQYGYVEIRAKVPKGQGLWPALWLLAEDPKSVNEIDIMESIGKDTTEIHTTLHYGQHGGNQGGEGSTARGSDYSQGYHTYAVDWEWNKITWYIDGKAVYQVTDHVPHEPMYVIANLAVGGVWPGPPDRTTLFPARFDIDYIHVFAPNNSK